MSSRMESSGRTMIAELNCDVMSRKLYVTFCDVMVKGGGWNVGNPPLTWAVTHKKDEPIESTIFFYKILDDYHK
jgi:hypothetical protein